MAINFKEINDKLFSDELNKEELEEIDELEKSIDNMIIKDYKGDDIHIDLREANFKHNIKPLNEARAKKMRNELDKRYKSAGWVITEKLIDNDTQEHWWILNGKN